jgi:glutathione S-transferase
MIKLYGAPLSNYHNMVKCALLEKGIAFEEVLTRPSQESDYLSRSPMGKIPCLQTEQGFLTETHAILDYLEDMQPSPALLPADAWSRAKVRELVQSLELYVELVARRGLGFLFGREVPDAVKADIARDLPKGLAAVGKLASFSPWIAGSQFTYADLFAYWTFGLARLSGKHNAELDVFAALPGSKAWFDAVAARPSVARALADQAAARAPRT